jgi:hypothetical protein
MRLSEINIPRLDTTIKEGTWIQIRHAFDGLCDYQVIYMDEHSRSPIMFLRPYGAYDIKHFNEDISTEAYEELVAKYGEDTIVEFTHPDLILGISSGTKTLEELLREL